ncbi:MAG: DNA primase [Gemmatimonadetes bacterium]|nr:DNA primase [Gemmatimonadota bacterium]
MIPEEVVDQVQAGADIVAIIGEHVRLKKVGSVFRGPCPFHQGTNPNFSVMPKGGYHCFVCHEKGSVFTFVQKRLGMSFPEAVKFVGEKSGIEVREVQRKREGPDPREPLWELIATAAAWFSTMLWENPAGKGARDYLERRNISRPTAEKFGIGFAPPEIGSMRAYLSGLGFDDARQLDVGLLSRREEHEEPRPRFRDRLIFPILDASAHAVGFGGRLLGPGEPKYVNSAESSVFSKGRLLYNYSGARHAIRRAERVVLVEGYFDVVRLVEAGLEEVVAPMGTALTDDQADLLARSTTSVFLLYDSDTPGQKASFRAADVLLARGLSVRMVTLPDGEDPDTFVSRNGRAAMEKLLEEALDVFDRKVQLLERGGWFGDLQRKRRALDRLLPTIRATTDPITRDLYLARTAEAAGIERSVLARELEMVPRRRGVRTAAPGSPAGRGQSDDRGHIRRSEPDPLRAHVLEHVETAPESSAERELIRVMLLHPDTVERIVEDVARIETDESGDPGVDGADATATAHVFRDPVYAQIFAALAASPEATPELLGDQLGELENHVVEALRSEPGAIVDPGRTIVDAVRMLRARALRERIDEHARMLPLATEEDKQDLLRREIALRKELAAVGGREWRSVRRQD